MKRLFLLCLLLLTPLNSQNFWEHLDGPEGASIRAITKCSDGKILAKANASDELYASNDYGDNWSVISTQITDAYNFLPCNDGRIYCAASSQGLLLSHDGGANWQNISSGIPPNTTVYTVHKNLNGDLFAGTYKKGIFRSTDNGSTFIKTANGLTDSSIFLITNNSLGHLFIATVSKGIFKSTDNGATWLLAGQGIPLSFNYIVSLHCDIYNNLFAVTNQAGIFRSTDSGTTWSNTNSGLPFINSGRIISGLGNGSLILGTTVGIYKSTDHGLSWDLASPNYPHAIVYTLAVDGSNHIYAGGFGFGVLKSVDSGHSWAKKCHGMSSASITNIVFTPDDELIVSTQGNGIVLSTDYGIIWQERNSGHEGSIINDLKFYDGILYCCAQITEGGFYSSADKGLTWTNSSTGLQNALGVKEVIRIGETRLLLGTGSGLYMSADMGLSWNKMTSFPDYYVTALYSDDNINLFCATSQGIFHSSNTGSSWNLLSIAENTVYRITGNSLGLLIIGGDNCVYISTDRGASWTNYNSGLQSAGYINDLIYVNDMEIYAGTSAGVYYSSDGGLNWQARNSGAGSIWIESLALGRNKILYAGSAYSGLFKSTSAVTSIISDNLSPSDFTVSDCYPNPFNPATAVDISLTTPGKLIYEVFDITGTKILQIESEFCEPGNKKINFDFASFPSGNYFVKFSNGSTYEFRKFMLLK